jgi:hypothetical protein
MIAMTTKSSTSVNPLRKRPRLGRRRTADETAVDNESIFMGPLLRQEKFFPQQAESSR